MISPSIDLERPVAATVPVAETFGDVVSDSSSRRSTLRGDEDLHVQVAEEASGEPQNDEFQDSTSAAHAACYGRHRKTVLWIGLALMYIVFELDHTALYNYQNFAASEFNQVSSLGALATAGTIIVAVMKPPIAKISDVVGRAETYIAVVLFYVASYIMCATAPNFRRYAAGYGLYSIGATGMQILNQIIVADITSSRWRGLANSMVSLPFMLVPWLSAFLVDSTMAKVGWRWGIGMFAIIMPVMSTSIIGPVFYFRRRGRRESRSIRCPTTTGSFYSAVDAVGIVLLATGVAMFLLPMALAGNIAGGWTSPWVPTVMASGVLLLGVFGFYEMHHAVNPVMPAKYFGSLSLVLACAIGLLDAFSFQVTHTYMYAWSTVVHDFSARNATFLTYTSGCFQVLSGLTTGFSMYHSRKYKWLLVVGTFVRLAGYGVMMRLRGAANPIFELFIVQAIQGVGSGIVGTVVIVIAQVVVPSTELGQASALILLAIFMGQAIGSAVAGGIYTNLFKPRLRAYLGDAASQRLIDIVFNSITSRLPDMGTPERSAINNAYSDVLRYMTVAALVASAVPFFMVWFLPNLQLSDKHNLSEEEESRSESWGGRSTPGTMKKVRKWLSHSEKGETEAILPKNSPAGRPVLGESYGTIKP